MLQWVSHSNIFLFLDNNGYTHTAGPYECLCGRGARLLFDAADLLGDRLPQGQWLMGHISYDLKNQLEQLESRHPEIYGYAPAQFFIPEAIAILRRNTDILEIQAPDPESVLQEILSQEIPEESTSLPKVSWTTALSKEAYLQTVDTLRAHIREGDCYEINLCNAAVAESVSLDPLQVFRLLNQAAPNPFAAFYRNEDNYAICASPERFLLREARKITAQPIKGTIRRGRDAAEDQQLCEQLFNSIKDRAENVMITDLMRNDLARLCDTGSVCVEELFGLYAFPRVHQMISTISGTLREDIHIGDILRKSFPMGSMTGAPKIKVMELIDRYEQSRRELFSGSLGYIQPDGDFDFNVMIRSLFYHQKTQRLSYQTGGAITYDSDPLQEWEETRLKASAIEQLFQ